MLLDAKWWFQRIFFYLVEKVEKGEVRYLYILYEEM